MTYIRDLTVVKKKDCSSFNIQWKHYANSLPGVNSQQNSVEIQTSSLLKLHLETSSTKCWLLCWVSVCTRSLHNAYAGTTPTGRDWWKHLLVKYDWFPNQSRRTCQRIKMAIFYIANVRNYLYNFHSNTGAVLVMGSPTIQWNGIVNDRKLLFGISLICHAMMTVPL